MAKKSAQVSSPEEMTNLVDPLEIVQTNISKLLDVAHVDTVYGEPVQHGDTTIIPCAEVTAGMGFGVGYGFGNAPKSVASEEEATEPAEGQESETQTASGGGSGGGGGGSSFSRPVAIIIASPQGVRVEPVFDITKIVLAALTAAGFMIGMIARMRNPGRFK